MLDSQCGIKAFSAELTNALIPTLTINKFAFDIELYYFVIKHRVTYKLLPVREINSGVSTVNISRDGLQALIDTLKMIFHWYQFKEKEQRLLLEKPVYWKSKT